MKEAPQIIIQRATALNLALYRRNNPEGQNLDEVNREIQELVTFIKTQIALWGGISAIDGYLERHDPEHLQLHAFNIDWNNL